MAAKVPAILRANSPIMIVGEAPGGQEELQLRPFVGPAGGILNEMLLEAGIGVHSCSISNVCKFRPPQNDIGAFFLDAKRTKPREILEQGIAELREEIIRVRPNLVVAAGETALWALTGKHKITNWRGSILESTLVPGTKVIPIYHPAAILRMYEWRWITVNDLRRAARESATPDIPTHGWTLHTRPSYDDALGFLHSIPEGRVSVDIETRLGHIACIGVSRSPTEAMCFPLMCQEDSEGYWSAEQEHAIVLALRSTLMRQGAQVIGQNWIYDLQYIARHWGFAPMPWMDTMLGHHVCFAGLPKGLDFLASMYCNYYQFWKAESKDWGTRMSEDELWEYNCKDVLYTLEAADAIDRTIDKLKLRAPFEFQMQLFRTVFRMMLRGVRFDHTLRGALTSELLEEIGKREQLVEKLLGEPINIRSPKQLQLLFYQQLGQKEVLNRKTGRPTTDDEALSRLVKREPLLQMLVGAINETRYLGTALGVVSTSVDSDQRLRCSYNIAGTVTFRLSSSEDAFGFGTNLQNITKGRKSLETGLQLPNLRRLIIPDEGYEMFDADLDRADAQVVAWEADDQELKQIFREGVDLHEQNAKVIGCARQQAKQGVHAANYGASARTIAYHLGITLHQADQFLHRWFSAHPNIKAWHKRVEGELATRRFVTNRFGYRKFFYSRVDNILPEALAWIPQSTVAITIDKGAVALEAQVPQAEILLQVHDSLTFQLPQREVDALLPLCAAALHIPIPYPDPLVIPVGFKRSTKSWGECG